MGTVKDLVVIKDPEEKKPGEGIFVFTDNFSVFDYGRMPDLIQGKGQALCLISAYFFEKLAEKDIRNHYIGLLDNGKTKYIDELESPTNKMKIVLFRVIRPKRIGNRYDYSVFKEIKGNYLIPLEIIYRNYLPKGSSVFKRLKEGKLTLEELGLKEHPKPGQKLEKPIIDVSTKLENVDRYISWEEAMEISGLSTDEIEYIKKVSMKINELISSEIEKVGLINEDGKFEFAIDYDRRIFLVDAVGTPDECRFSFEGTPISKEVIRMYYRKTSWFKEIEKAKESGTFTNLPKPPLLPPSFKNLVSEMYKSVCNMITGIKFFEARPIKEIIGELREFIGDQI